MDTEYEKIQRTLCVESSVAKVLKVSCIDPEKISPEAFISPFYLVIVVSTSVIILILAIALPLLICNCVKKRRNHKKPRVEQDTDSREDLLVWHEISLT